MWFKTDSDRAMEIFLKIGELFTVKKFRNCFEHYLEAFLKASELVSYFFGEFVKICSAFSALKV